MKSFRFRLDKVLEWRRKKLEMAQARQHSLRQEISAIDQSIEDRHSAMTLHVSAPTSGFELSTFQRYLSRLQRDVVGLQERRRVVSDLLRAQNERVIEADRSVKILERLREKRLSEWDKEAEKELELLSADVVSNRWAANRVEQDGSSVKKRRVHPHLKKPNKSGLTENQIP